MAAESAAQLVVVLVAVRAGRFALRLVKGVGVGIALRVVALEVLVVVVVLVNGVG